MPLLHRRSEHDHDVDVHDRLEGYGPDRSAEPDPRSRASRVAPAAGAAAAPTAVDERVSMSTHQGWNSAVRVVAVVASAAVVLLGAIALLRIDWTDGMDSAATDVAGLAFTPWVAIVTAVVGVVALLAAASGDRSSKLVVGAVLAVVGIGILVIGDADRADLDVESAHGWLAIGLGAVLVVCGLLLRRSWTTRRKVSTAVR